MTLAYQFKAGGQKNPPKTIKVGQNVYHREKIFKHDFFAATALYTCQDQKIVLKWSRSTDFMGFPLAWLGRWISHRELRVLQHLQTVANTPRLIGPYQTCGVLYEFIEGVSLDSRPEIPDDFFDRLEVLLKAIHASDVAYFDLNKKGNILLGQNGEPYLIDFQISWYHQTGIWPFRSMCRKALQKFQKEDFYHLVKQKRRFRPDLMTETEIQNSRRISSVIKFHRQVAKPYFYLRRKLFGWLINKGLLATGESEESHSETRSD